MRAARLALLEGGPGAVRVETLARKLRVSKGSFYWHFKNREALLEALLCEWEEEKSLLFDLVEKRDAQQALASFFEELERRVVISERGEWPSDAAIFGWAAVSPKVARRANKEERVRIRLLKKLFRQNELGEFFYMAYLGFLLRRRRVPEAAKNFPILVKICKALLRNPPRGLKRAVKSAHVGEKS
ncbi:MAG TPA: helix-turn-helix domain-containing protein [Candidatus Angelobacter sp.]|nr:helix-turn-helix domain-containing protein [Candidatus Angelobacter sp.]